MFARSFREKALHGVHYRDEKTLDAAVEELSPKAVAYCAVVTESNAYADLFGQSDFHLAERMGGKNMATPMLVIGAAGRVGAVGRTVTELLLQQGKAMRAMVRHADDRAQALRDLGAEVVVGDLLDLDAMHRMIAGCETMDFGMSVSDTYLAATVNAAVAKRYDPVAYFTEGRPVMGQATYAAVHSGVRRATGALGTATARP